VKYTQESKEAKTIVLPSGIFVTVFPPPPKGFDPLLVDEPTRLGFGLPSRPSDRSLVSIWERLMAPPFRLIEPIFKRMENIPPRTISKNPADVSSDNWSGGLIPAPSGSTFQSAFGTWTIPATISSRPAGESHASLWVGIDGQPGEDLFQAGVECVAVAGEPSSYYAWWEWVPDDQVQIPNLPVSAGQIVSCLLTVISNKSGAVFLKNMTTGDAVAFQVTAPAGALRAHIAEWIAERTKVNGALSTLADYGRVTFTIAASTHVGLTGMGTPAILGETSPTSPTLTSLNGRLYLSWRGLGNDLLSVACSTDNGRTFPHKFVSSEKTSDAPILCAHNGNLFIAWKGVDNPSLSVATVTLSGDTIVGLANKVILQETSPVAPTLASLNGRLYLSWRGVDNNQISIACSTNNGRTFEHKFISGERTSDTPVLCAHNGNLFVAWKGVDNPALSVATVVLSGDAITGLAGKVILQEISPNGPAMASAGGRLYLCWRGVDNDLLSVSYSLDMGRTFGHKFVALERSSDSPALGVLNGQLFAAWKGVDNTLLSVATVSTAEEATQAIDFTSTGSYTNEMTQGGAVVSVAAIESATTVECRYTGPTLPAIINPVILPDTSPASPTLASLDARLYMSWQGVGNNQLSVAASADDGKSFGHKFISGEKSSDAPVLCAHDGKLIIAWKGVDNPSLSVATVGRSGDNITGFATKVILRETSPTSPTMASLDGRLYMSWRGVDNNQLSVACSTDDGQTFINKLISGEKTSDAPVLCAHNGNLFIAWKGVDNPLLSVAVVTLAGDTITGIVNKVILRETTPTSPTLASINGRLYLSWRETSNKLSVAFSDDDGRTFGAKFVSTETSSDAPVLCSHDSKLFVGWKGVDNTSLTVAGVRL
jgi:hypothetical protein